MMAKTAACFIDSQTWNYWASQFVTSKAANPAALCNSIFAIWEVLLSS
jgi:hypothetical protein